MAIKQSGYNEATDGDTFKHWSTGPNLHRWYFDDGSYIQAGRYSIIHKFKITTHGVLAFEIYNDKAGFVLHNLELVEEIARVLEVDVDVYKASLISSS